MVKQTILVIDDEKRIRAILASYLQSEGFEVMEAEDGNIALAKINEYSPSLVILDLMLPGLKGWQVCSEIKRIMNIPIIMVTACDDQKSRILCFEAGADDFLAKPFNPKELLCRIKAILRRTCSN